MLLWHLDQEVLRKNCLTNTVFSARRWTDGVVKKKVLYYAFPLYHICFTLSPILRSAVILSFTDVAGENFLPAT